MKAPLLLLISLWLPSAMHAQSDSMRARIFEGMGEFYGSACPGDSLTVSIYSTNGQLLSTLVIPDDAQLAIYSDSSRRYQDLTEFRGIVKIRSMACSDIVPSSGRWALPAMFSAAPIQVDLKQAFVVVYTNE